MHPVKEISRIYFIKLFNLIKYDPKIPLYRYVCSSLALLSKSILEKSFYLSEIQSISYRHFLSSVMAKKFK